MGVFSQNERLMKLDPKKTALLTLDFQKGIFGLVPGAEAIVPQAAKAVEFARQQPFQIIHVGLGFSEGHPEIPDRDLPFKRVKVNNLFVKGTPSAEFHSAIARPGELAVHKQRVGAFSENQLHLILRARGIENLVLLGITTSGIVLSTLRRAFDLDYRCVVLKDACFDPDEEVHRVLTGKIFQAQATVVTVDAFITGQGE
jgi:nicotinamidase-related amidase